MRRCGESDRDRAGGGKVPFIERTYSYGFRDIEVEFLISSRSVDQIRFNEDACILSGRFDRAKEIYEAIAFFDEAIETNPSLPRLIVSVGRAKNLKGDKTGAFEGLEEIFGTESRSEEARR